MGSGARSSGSVGKGVCRLQVFLGGLAVDPFTKVGFVRRPSRSKSIYPRPSQGSSERRYSKVGQKGKERYEFPSWNISRSWERSQKGSAAQTQRALHMYSKVVVSSPRDNTSRIIWGTSLLRVCLHSAHPRPRTPLRAPHFQFKPQAKPRRHSHHLWTPARKLKQRIHSSRSSPRNSDGRYHYRTH